MSTKYDDLQKLAELKDKGILTEAEFETQKAAILKDQPPAPATSPTPPVPELPEDVRKQVTLWRVWGIRNPRQYGGVRRIALTLMSVFWPIGLVGAIVLASSKSLVRRKQGHAMLFGSIVIGILSIIVFSSGGGVSVDPTAAMVQQSKLAEYPQRTVGEAVGSFFGSVSWSSGQAEDGNTYVNAKGRIMVAEQEVDAALQFKISTDRKTFEINALEFNGVPQSAIVLQALLEKMFTE